MLSVNSRPQIIRKTTSEYIKVVWECIRNIRIQKQTATLDKLVKAISRENNIDEESSKRLLLMVEADGLIERGDPQALKTISSVNGSYANNDFFNLPDFSKPFNKGLKDWYCFVCHLPGELHSCTECFRGYHIHCYKEIIPRNSRHHRFAKSNDKFICPTCESRTETNENFSRKQVRKLLDFATHFIRKKSVWKDMLTIGFRGEIVKNEYLVYRYCDLELIQRKIKDGRYVYLNDLVDDAEIFVHDVCILHGIFSDKADQARVLLREIKDEISEVQMCADCYINAKAKLAEWITKPCEPSHKLIWARQSTTPGAHFYWPAKLLLEKSDGYEVRFFGGNHDRAFVKKHDTKSFHFRPDEIEIKHGSCFDRAWIEVKKLKEKIEQGYYTHSSGESDLPPTEDDYSDEIYLSERRTTGLSITDNNLANGSNYSLLSSLSSRRSSALEKNRKTILPISINGKTAKKVDHPNIISKSTKRSSSKSGGGGGPLSKKPMTNNNVEKSVSSYVRSEKSTSGRSSKKQTKHSQSDSDTSDNSDNDSDNSSSSVNIKSLNYKFSPKPSSIRSPSATMKSLRQNRKPSTKFSQLTSVRYLSLSDRIKMDLSSTDSSEFDPKEERPSYTRKRPKKDKFKTSPQNKPFNVNKPKRSPVYPVNLDLVSSKQEKLFFPPNSIKHSETSSSNEDTDRCCSPDHLSTSPLFRSGPNQRLGKLPMVSSKRGGVAAADSTSNNTGIASVNQPMPATPSVSTTSPYPNRQRINSGYNPIINQSKRMVHKCIATTLPICNCQEKFDKQLEEERLKLQQDHSLIIVELENKLKHEFEETKLNEINKATEEIRVQMQEIIEKDKAAAQDALIVAETRHSEALINTKRRQWCRNCLKEAIYHCCWNTSYCSIQCQQEHWQKEHKRVCRRKR